MRRTILRALVVLLFLAAARSRLEAQPAPPPTPASSSAAARPPAGNAHLSVHRAAGPITIDGDISDPGWAGAAEIGTFYEIQPGDSTPPKVKTTAYVTYDDRFLYVAIRCDDPDPKKIRAHFVERDHVSSDQDFAGIFLDTKNNGRTGIELFVNPYGNMDDFARDESIVSGNNEDPAPDFFWDAAAKITAQGWQAEFRIPFSTLRYSSADPQTWGIVAFRNWPRDFRYQIASNPAPRESNCFICHAMKLDDISGLPHGAHFVAAPYATFAEKGVPRGDPGTPYANKPIRSNAGLDAKFIPNESTAIDATVNPDFSQIESDVAQISADARFALFYPEKRPFFMEQSQIFNMPIQAVYTRTITSPRWGVRATGEFDGNSYTILTGEDRGGGSVILPGSTASSTAPQDFQSSVTIGRIQHALPGRSFASFLVTDREIQGGGHNRVFGPDFQWTPGDQDQVVGQFLLSSTETPDRPDLAAEWTGRSFGSHALFGTWNHSSYHWNWTATYRDFGEGFRADDGFVPQVGIREGSANVSYVLYTGGILSRVIPVLLADDVVDRNGNAVTRILEPGIAFQGKLGLQGEIDYNAYDKERAGPNLLGYERLHVNLYANPPGSVSTISFDGHMGRSIDFIEYRSGRGGDFTLSATARPTLHLQFDANVAGQWLYLDGRRLFRAQAERLKATYVFSRSTFVRLIGQYLRTDYDTSRYTTALPKTSGAFDGSALFGYQLNWQSVIYLGYGDTRSLSEEAQFQRSGRQLFLKISYAFQR
jgi:hypothetical protein